MEAIIVATSDQLFVIPAHRRASFCAQSSTARFQVRAAPAEGSNHDTNDPVGAAVADPVTRTRQSALRAHGLGSVTGIARATRSAASIQTKVNTLAGGGLHPH
jgi:hypothetical protein